jgi:hypothetical protein
VLIALAAFVLLAAIVGVAAASSGNAKTVRDSVYPSASDSLREAGITVDSGGFWIFDVTCAQIKKYPGIIQPMAVESAEELNTPLGKQAAIDAIARDLPIACQGVSPDYQPENDAFNMAEQETGGNN